MTKSQSINHSNTSWPVRKCLFFTLVIVLPLMIFLQTRSGGKATSLLTSPLDFLRTCLQSDFYRSQLPPHRSIPISPTKSFRLFRASLRHFGEIFHILFSISSCRKLEGTLQRSRPGTNWNRPCERGQVLHAAMVNVSSWRPSMWEMDRQ